MEIPPPPTVVGGMVRSTCLNKTGRWAADSQRPEIPPPPTVVGGMVRNAA